MTVETSTWATRKGLAQMLKGGVIMDVVTPEQAKIAEDAGAVAVMALERVPADIRAAGGVARMSDPSMIEGIMSAVTIPVMAKARIGHFVEAQVLEALGVDYIDESEVLTPADETNHIDKHAFKVPFVCGCRNLGEALRRINEGAAMIRTKGEAGTGNIVEAVRQLRDVLSEIRRIQAMRDDEECFSSLGRNATAIKTAIFAVGSGLAGLAGALYGHYAEFLSPEQFGIIQSGLILTMVVVGGMGSTWGPVVGALLLTALPQAITFLNLPPSVMAPLQGMLYTGLVLLFLYVRPAGLVSR